MRRRQAFTITELLVVMALLVFIMYILAEAFSAGSSALRSLKAVGDMNEKLRATTTILRRYLGADHFEGRKRLSSPSFWYDGPPQEGFFRIWQDADSIDEGTDLDSNHSFRAPGPDPLTGHGGVNARGTWSNHGLHFAVKLRGNTRDAFFRATLPGGSPLLALPLIDTRFQEPGGTTLCSSWAEVAFFLRPSAPGSVAVPGPDGFDQTEGPSAPAGASGLPLYTLYMRQRLAIADNAQVPQAVPANAYVNNGDYVEMSCYRDLTSANVLYFNNPSDLTMPGRRLGKPPNRAAPNQWAQCPATTGDLANNSAPGGGARPGQSPNGYPILAEEPPATGGKFAGGDILLDNVVSFEIRVLLPLSSWTAVHGAQAPGNIYDFVTLAGPAVQQFNQNTAGAAPFKKNRPPYVFDTWSQARDNSLDYSGWSTTNKRTSIPLLTSTVTGEKIRLLAIQITIRIWDAITSQTRQTSIVVDL
jgi:hypothetical protein